MQEGVWPKVYAARHKSSEVVTNSRSGGYFTAISDIIFSLGGVVAEMEWLFWTGQIANNGATSTAAG